MLDFASLSLELLKHQDQLSARKIAVEPEWNVSSSINTFSGGPQLDTLVLTNHADFKQFQFRIIRHSWNERQEFSLSSNGIDRFFYRIDSMTGQPVKINKVSLSRGLWGATEPALDLQEFAKEVYRILQDLSIQYSRNTNLYYGYLSTQVTEFQ